MFDSNEKSYFHFLIFQRTKVIFLVTSILELSTFYTDCIVCMTGSISGLSSYISRRNIS